jgi:hypothetical protein
MRRQALDEETLVRGWGLTLFLRRGLVAWMRAWPPESSQTPNRPGRLTEPRPVRGERGPVIEGAFPSQLYSSVATLLAEMILETRQEVLP